MWTLTVYDEEKSQKLNKDLCQAFLRIRDYYSEEEYSIQVLNIGDTIEDTDFKIVSSKGETVGDLEFLPDDYVPMPMEEARKLAKELGFEIEEK